MSDFEEIKDDYESIIEDRIKFSGKDHAYYTQVKVDLLIEATGRNIGSPGKLKFLDLGCGIGVTDTLLVEKVSDLHGIDIFDGVIEKAKVRNPSFKYQTFDGKTIPYDNNNFDVVFAICVMHHVPPEQWEELFKDVERVLKPGGLFFVFEHNPLNPLTQWVVKNTPFDDDAVLLRNGVTCRLMKNANLKISENKFILFTPWDHSVFKILDKNLRWLPFGAQYYVAGKKL